jgi:tripartite-type tricarboxylate transporter receptor subunit TctC
VGAQSWILQSPGTTQFSSFRGRAAFKQAVEDPQVQKQMREIDLTPVWIDHKTYEATLRKVSEDANKLSHYLKN